MSDRYRIRDWDTHFETAQSRKVDRLNWVGVPNKQHGLGLTYILSLVDGAAIYGIWNLILGGCSQQRSPREGWLTQDGTASGVPWSAEDLALKWRRPVEEVARAISILSSPKVAWIQRIDELGVRYQQTTSMPPTQDRTGQDKQDRAGGAPAAQEDRSADDIREANQRAVRVFLVRKRMACDDVAFQEWLGLCQDARCATVEDAKALIAWLKIEGPKRGIISRYARHHEPLLPVWRARQRSLPHDAPDAPPEPTAETA